MVEVYQKKFSPNMGAGANNPRWVIGEETFGEFSRTLITLSEDAEAAGGGPDAPKHAPQRQTQD